MCGVESTGRRRSPGRCSGVDLAMAGLVALGAACDQPTSPTGAEAGDFVPGELIALETSPAWSTRSVSWLDPDPTGRVPEDRYALLATSLRVPRIAVSADYLFRASFGIPCSDDACAPGGGWNDPALHLEALAWSPNGAEVTFEGRAQLGMTVGPSWIYVMPGAGGEPRRRARGLMPTFNRDGSRIIYVAISKAAIAAMNPSSGESVQIFAGLAGIESPSFAPDNHRIAFAAMVGSSGRRIFVWDADQPGSFPDPVSDPDDAGVGSRDGVDDRLPVWSPEGEFVAYAASVTRTPPFRDAIFVTAPAREPELIVRVAWLPPGEKVTDLAWHPNGRLLLIAVGGDARALVMPERFWAFGAAAP